MWMTLSQNFDYLEELLLHHRESIGVHNGVPFIMLIYEPHEEIECRNKIKSLKEKLNSKGLKILTIPMNKFIFEHLREEGILEEVFEYDRKSPKEIREELYKKCKRYLKPFILKQIEEGSPDVIFVTNVASLHPYYRVSSLFNSLENCLEMIPPFIVFYPGEIRDKKLYFLGEFESSDYYRAQKIGGI